MSATFTIGSPKQLGDMLFERLGLPGGRKGKTGAYSHRRHRARAARPLQPGAARRWCSNGAS